MRRMFGATVGFLVAGSMAVLVAQGIRIMSGSSSALGAITAGNALEVVFGRADRASYIVSAANQAVTTYDSIINIQAGAAQGFRIAKMCIEPGSAATSGYRLWQLIRTTTAPTAGVTIGPETTTGNNAFAKMDPSDASYSGTVMIGGTEGTSGAIIDSGVLYVPVTINGSSSVYTDVMFCHHYGTGGDKLPTVQAGTTNGVKLMFSGVGGGTGVSGQIHFIAN